MSDQVEQAIQELCDQVAEAEISAAKSEIPCTSYGRDDFLDVLGERSEDEWNAWGKRITNVPRDCRFLMRVAARVYEDIDWIYHTREQRDDTFGDRQRREIDESTLARRAKEIQKAKESEVYKKFVANVPAKKRNRACPRTPNKYQGISRRAWDGAVKQWKIDLHAWEAKYDTQAAEVKENRNPKSKSGAYRKRGKGSPPSSNLSQVEAVEPAPLQAENKYENAC